MQCFSRGKFIPKLYLVMMNKTVDLSLKMPPKLVMYPTGLLVLVEITLGRQCYF